MKLKKLERERLAASASSVMMKYTLFYIKSVVPFLTAELILKKAIFRPGCQVGAERFEWFMNQFAACECSAYRSAAYHC